MQNYINPIELLNLKTEIESGLENSAIRKAKKILLAEIELSDSETICLNGIELTKSDCLRAIDDLDHKDKKDFHLFIFENSDLNNFLSNGDLTFFKTYKIESIYKLSDFIDFVSPFFSAQYSKALSLNFKLQNFTLVKDLVSIKPLVNETYIEDCFKSTYSILRDIESEVIEITKDIELNKSEHVEEGFSNLTIQIRNKVDVDLINLLPSFFQSIRNQIAHSVRNLARDLNNDPYNEYNIAFQIIDIANSINTEGLVNQTITKGYYTIKKNYEDSVGKITNPINQTLLSPKIAPIEIDDDDSVDKDNNSIKVDGEKGDSKNSSYWLFLSVSYAVGFFYSPVQKVVLGVSILMIAIPLIFLRKDNDFSISTYIKKYIVLIGIAILGFFYTLVAQVYVMFYFFMYLHNFISEITKKKEQKNSRIGFWHYASAALIITLLYYNYFTDFKPLESDSVVVVEKELTDKEYFQKGLSSFQLSNYEEAIIQYDKAINLNPNYAEAYGDRGACKANLSQYEVAITDYQKAEELGMSNSTLYSNWGYALYKLKQEDKAFEFIKKALKIDPQNGNAYRIRAEIKYDKNDNLGASEDYTIAIQYNPNATNYFSRGLAYYYLKDYKKSIYDIDKAIQLNPNSSQYYYDRGDVKDMMNDINGACKDWQTAKDKGYDVPDYKLKRCNPQIINISNGEIEGCYDIKPKYNKSIDNKLLITVGSNASVAVKLIDISNEKCVRYVFINKNTSYTIRNIPEGKYYLKIAYGEDWSIMDGQTNCTGRFSKNALFEKGEDVLDYNLIYSNKGYQVPSFSLKLDVQISEDKLNSFNTDKINENDFYNE